jgi:threonine dehydratase
MARASIFPIGGGFLSAVNRKTGALAWQVSIASATGVPYDKARATPVIVGDKLIVGTIELAAIHSIASSLGARKVAEQAFNWTAKHAVHNVVVSDRQAVKACESFIRDHRIVVEPACGAALAAVYENVEAIRAFNKVAVIVCGGVTATLEHLEKWGGD